MKKVRLDQLLSHRGLCESREKAQRLIRAGKVTVNGQVKSKPGHTFDPDAHIAVRAPERFVSRGGKKLEAAFSHFDLNVCDQVCIDVGASTGGFTDCLLQHGAARVYAVDVGRGQLHWKLRNDKRVVLMEGINARYLNAGDFQPRPGFATLDASFISLTKLLPAVTHVLASKARIVTLIKPQFEAGKEQVERGGVVRDPEIHQVVINRIRQFGEQEQGLIWLDMCTSPLRGPAGNIEFLSYWEKPE